MIRFIIVLYCWVGILIAHPTTFKTGKVLWLIKNKQFSDLRFGYSASHKWLLGARYLEFDNSKELLLNSNWLIKRWNQTGAQGNLYLLTNFNENSFHYGLQGDWENRRWYVAQMIDSYNNDISFESRIGWSPYLVDYDGLSTWIILQNMNGQIKPILRFFFAREIARFTVTVDFPTPPLPEPITIIFLIIRIINYIIILISKIFLCIVKTILI